jgi:methyltransferase family protein
MNRILRLKFLPPFLRPAALKLYRILPDRIRFSRIYRTNMWQSGKSRSGPGSTLAATVSIRLQLAALLQEIGVRTIVDAGCGDFNWLSRVDLKDFQYIGVDVVGSVIIELRQEYQTPSRRFVLQDIVKSLTSGDLVFCRHVLQHLPNRDIMRFLAAVSDSKAHYLLTTTYPEVNENVNTYRGGLRLNNMERPPFNLPPAMRMFEDGDGPLGLWRVEQLPCSRNK